MRTIGEISDDRLPRFDPTRTPLRVDIGRPRPRVATLELFGEVDVATAPLLVACLESVVEPAPRLVVVSLAHVDFLGIRGLAALSDARADLAASGGTLCLASVPAAVRRLLDLSGAAATLPVHATVAEALGRLAAPAA